MLSAGHCCPWWQWIFVCSPYDHQINGGWPQSWALAPSLWAGDNTRKHEQTNIQSQALVICITHNNQLGSAAAIKSNTESQHSSTQTTTLTSLNKLHRYLSVQSTVGNQYNRFSQPVSHGTYYVTSNCWRCVDKSSVTNMASGRCQ